MRSLEFSDDGPIAAIYDVNIRPDLNEAVSYESRCLPINFAGECMKLDAVWNFRP